MTCYKTYSQRGICVSRPPALPLVLGPNLYLTAPALNLHSPLPALNLCLLLHRFTVKVCYSYSVGARKNAPGKNAHSPEKCPWEKCPQENYPPGKLPPGKLPPRKITPQENCPPRNIAPLKRVFCKASSCYGRIS